MVRKIAMSVMAVSFFASIAAAEEIKIDFDGASKAALSEQLAGIEVPQAVPAPADDKGIIDWLFGRKEPKGPAEWTIMVYGNGKNDLERFLLRDLNEMEKIGSTDKVNVIVEAGRIAGYDSSDGDWKGVRRYRMIKDNDTSRVTSPVLQDLGESDMGDYRNVIKFVQWAREAYPARKYMLIFWNHGSGWSKSGEPVIVKGISYDEQSGNHINTPEMGVILKALGKLDVVGSDACLMQMAEVDYEIKDSVDYIVASEETEPGDGYTYDLFLGPVVKRPTMTPFEVGKQAVDGYSDHYDSVRQGYTQSLVKASEMNRLLTMTNDFVDAVMASGDKFLAKASRNGAINYAVAENRDLYDFVRLMIAGTRDEAVLEKGRALMGFIDGTLVVHNRTRDSQGSFWSGPKAYTLSKGIAAYFPNGSTLDAGYADLAWAKASRWDEFVLWINQP